MNTKFAVLLLSVVVAWASGAPLEVAVTNNVFTASLYRELIKTNEGNIVVSPFSIDVILALTESGAKDKTAEEIRTSLNLPGSDAAIQEMFKMVLPVLKSDDNFTLNTANKIYVKDSLALKEHFESTAREAYQAEVENIDFTDNEKAADAINEWVEEQTEHKIQNLVSPDILDPATAILLINALHFKGQWRYGFDSTSTIKKTFFKSARDPVEVEMMYNLPIYRQHYTDEVLEAQFLEMPFWGENISMVIALPNANDGIAILEEQIEKVFTPHKFKTELFEVQIPKFKVESTIGLKETLQNLGVKTAFKMYEADFSGIVNESDDLYISDVHQKAFIDVDESGVEAAAATVEAVSFDAMPRKAFVADRPFIFYIKFNELILFAGRVTVPEQ